MRLIEQQMNEAIHNQAMWWSKDNTQVFFDTLHNISHIRLHGHHIASYNHATGVMTPNLETLQEWPTRTTKSRLKALGVSVATRKGVTYVDDVAV